MAGINRFACITIAVKDQDEALQWFTEKLGFQKRVDRPGPGIRFLTVSPPKQPDLQVILASWFPEQIGKNPTAVLYTDDCRSTYDELRNRGVVFTEGPQEKPFGLQAVFRDLYGNSYALLEPGASHG
jgi:catechol 2,3-dioxygenase-like lactoylglutathione lyase family enzyme